MIDVTNAETFQLARARERYVDGRLDLTRFEATIEHVLRGGYLGANLELRSPLMDRVRRKRRQLACGHRNHLDIRGFADDEFICSDCGATLDEPRRTSDARAR